MFDRNNFQTPNASTNLGTLFSDKMMLSMSLFNDRFSVSMAQATGTSSYGNTTYDRNARSFYTLSKRSVITLVNAYDRFLKKYVENDETPENPITVSVLMNSTKNGYIRHLLWFGPEFPEVAIAKGKYVIEDNLDVDGTPTANTKKHEFWFNRDEINISYDPDAPAPENGANIVDVSVHSQSDFIDFVETMRAWITLSIPFQRHDEKNAARFRKQPQGQLNQNVSMDPSQFTPNPIAIPQLPGNMPVGDELPFTGGDGFFNN